MEFESVADDRLEVLYYAENDANEVKKKAGKLADGLAKYFNDGQTDSGITVEKVAAVDEASNIIATIKTPVGTGRLKLSWKVFKDGMGGNLILERRQTDALDRTFWEPVWGLAIPHQGDPYFKIGIHVKTATLTASFGGQAHTSAMRQVGLQMLYAMANGAEKQ